MAGLDEDTESPVGYLLLAPVLAVVVIAAATYLFRGRGPTTEDVKKRLADEAAQAKRHRRKANVASITNRLLGNRKGEVPSPSPTSPAPPPFESSDLGRSLESLQHHWYAGSITEDEYRAAKARLLGTPGPDDPYAEVAKLAELHRQGVLGDVEFAAAKARILGL